MGKIGFLFAGQGAQYPGMGKDLYDSSYAAKSVYDMGESIFPGILDLCFFSEKETLKLTENTQPALFLTDLACACAVSEKGFFPDAVAGFSLGEIAALAYAKILSYEDAFRLVCLRGRKMAECASRYPGSMAAIVKLSAQKVEELCSAYDSVYPVNYNCPGQISCAGSPEQIDLLCAAAKEAGGRGIKLAVSGAFHTPFMQEAGVALRSFLDSVSVHAPQIPIYSNLTGELYPSETDEIKNLICNQLSHSVRWETIIRKMNVQGIDTYLEVGAGKTLSGFVAKTITDAKIANVENCQGLDLAVSSIL